MSRKSRRPSFSVITPVFNGEAFIARCHFLLREQTVTDWEWIVVDDGSTDHTSERIERLQDRRIRSVRLAENRGRGIARNEALKQARGQWIVVWDVDDVYFPDRLARAREAQEAGYDFCCSYIVLIDDELHYLGARGFTRDDSGMLRTFVHGTLSCDLELIRQVGYSTCPTGEDFRVILALSSGAKGEWIQEALVAYQYGHGVSWRKALATNRARLESIRELHRDGTLDQGKATYSEVIVKLSMKITLLRLLGLSPKLYRLTVPLRTKGDLPAGWMLDEKRMSFLRALRDRNRLGDWSCDR